MGIILSIFRLEVIISGICFLNYFQRFTYNQYLIIRLGTNCVKRNNIYNCYCILKFSSMMKFLNYIPRGFISLNHSFDGIKDFLLIRKINIIFVHLWLLSYYIFTAIKNCWLLLIHRRSIKSWARVRLIIWLIVTCWILTWMISILIMMILFKWLHNLYRLLFPDDSTRLIWLFFRNTQSCLI